MHVWAVAAAAAAAAEEADNSLIGRFLSTIHSGRESASTNSKEIPGMASILQSLKF